MLFVSLETVYWKSPQVAMFIKCLFSVCKHILVSYTVGNIFEYYHYLVPKKISLTKVSLCAFNIAVLPL